MDINRLNQTSRVEHTSLTSSSQKNKSDVEFQGEMDSKSLNYGDTVGRSMLAKKPLTPQEKSQKLVNLMNGIEVNLGGEKMSLWDSLKYSGFSITDVRNRDKEGYVDGMISVLETLQKTSLDIEGNGERKPMSEVLSDNLNILLSLMFVDDFETVNSMLKELDNLGEFKGFGSIDLFNILSSYNPQVSTPESYVDSYYYFKTAEDENGEKIYDSRFSKRISNPVQYMMAEVANTKQEKAVEKLIQLTNSGVVDKHIYSYLPTGGQFNEYLLDDVNKLYDAYQNDVSPIDAFVPVVKTSSEGVEKAQVGDVFQVEGEEFIQVKNSNGEAERVNLTREMYFKLFPPIERFGTTQNQIGNCWELTGLNDMYSDSVSRADVLKAFRQQGEDVFIKFPNGIVGEIWCPRGELPSDADKKFYSQGAKGIQLLEYADGYERALASPETELQDKYDTVYTQSRDGGNTSDIYELFGYTDISTYRRAIVIKDVISKPKTFERYKVSWSCDGDGMEQPVLGKPNLRSNHAYRIKPAHVDSMGKVDSFHVINPWGVLENEYSIDDIVRYSKELMIARKPITDD